MLKGKGIGYKQQSFEDSSSEEEEKFNPKGRNSEQLNLTNAAELEPIPKRRQNFPSRNLPITATYENQESGCCSRICYTTKCALTATILTFVIFGIFVVTLDLTISGIESYAHHRPYSHYDERNTTLVKFELSGTETEYVKFEAIPYRDREQLFGIELNYAEVSISELEETFEYNRVLSNLKNLTLNNIKFKGVMPWNFQKRYDIPKSFENLQVRINGPIGRDDGFTLDLCNKCVGLDFNTVTPYRFNVSALQQRHCLESLLFFKRPYEWSGNLADVNYNFFLSVWGWTLLGLNNNKGEVISTLPYSDELIRNVTKSSRFTKSGVKVLRLREVKLNVSTLTSLSSTLQVLHLDNVDLEGFQGQRISSLLTNFKNLEELNLKFGNYENSATPKFQIFLDDLPGSLKSLTLANVQLLVTPNSTANFHLSDLNVYGAILQSDNFLENFPKYFKVRRVAWQVEKFNGILSKRSSWLSVLVAIGMADPVSIFLDKNGSSRLSVSPPPLKLIQMIPPSTFDLEVKAILFMKRNQNSEFLSHSPYGVPESSPKTAWYKRLKIDTFLNEKFTVDYNW